MPAIVSEEVVEKMRRAHCLNNEARAIMRSVADGDGVSEEIRARIRAIVEAMDLDDAEINNIRNQL